MANGQQYNYNTRRNGQWATVQTTKCRQYTRKRRKDANEYDTGQYTQQSQTRKIKELRKSKDTKE